MLVALKRAVPPELWVPELREAAASEHEAALKQANLKHLEAMF